ncbi:hypothetical protein EDD92_7356 [Streptomyces sp. TLI_185]|nr:hypothetical protein EDD92_7356 [Streptomyces sp. TLI_185]
MIPAFDSVRGFSGEGGVATAGRRDAMVGQGRLVADEPAPAQ